MSKYGRLRDEYFEWLTRENLPRESPEKLLRLSAEKVSPTQRKDLEHWIDQFNATGW